MIGDWDECQGTGGYADWGPGMRLSIKGANDETVGTGDVVNVDVSNIREVVQADIDGESPLGLDADNVSDGIDELRALLEAGQGTVCMLYFEADIEQSDFYSVELGQRGDLSYSRDDLKKNGFVVGITVGDL